MPRRSSSSSSSSSSGNSIGQFRAVRGTVNPLPGPISWGNNTHTLMRAHRLRYADALRRSARTGRPMVEMAVLPPVPHVFNPPLPRIFARKSTNSGAGGSGSVSRPSRSGNKRRRATASTSSGSSGSRGKRRSPPIVLSSGSSQSGRRSPAIVLSSGSSQNRRRSPRPAANPPRNRRRDWTGVMERLALLNSTRTARRRAARERQRGGRRTPSVATDLSSAGSSFLENDMEYKGGASASSSSDISSIPDANVRKELTYAQKKALDKEFRATRHRRDPEYNALARFHDEFDQPATDIEWRRIQAYHNQGLEERRRAERQRRENPNNGKNSGSKGDPGAGPSSAKQRRCKGRKKRPATRSRRKAKK